jgi:antimicrobial peptide system SdpA family protein
MSSASESPRLVAVWFFFVVGCLGVVGAYVLHAALPFNPIRLPFEDRVAMTLVLPEGWAFFTRNPREERTIPYLRSADGRWISAIANRLADPENLFGFSRAPRGQSVEMGLLTTQLAGRTWIACDNLAAECLESAPIAGEIQNPTPGATLCGTVGFVAQPPLPWAWWRSPRSQPIRMPARTMKVTVQC